MSLSCCLSVLLLAAIPTAVANSDGKVDPATLKDKVTIAPGKKLLVQFQEKEGALTAPKVVEKVQDRPPTTTFDFRKVGENYILSTKNPFSKDLKFRALVRVEGTQDYFETSIVPVKSTLLGIEVWQEPLEELVLFDFKLIEGD